MGRVSTPIWNPEPPTGIIGVAGRRSFGIVRALGSIWMQLSFDRIEKAIEPHLSQRLLTVWKVFVTLILNAILCAMVLASTRVFEILYNYSSDQSATGLLKYFPLEGLLKVTDVLVVVVFAVSMISTIVRFIGEAVAESRHNGAR
jgi:hypothetical protein